MQFFIGSLLGGLVQAAGTIAGKVLLALGFGIVAYSGYSELLGWIGNYACSALGSTGAMASGFLGFMKVDVATSIILSAVSVRLLIQGLTGGVIKRMVIK